jgi:hypothetical protein
MPQPPQFPGPEMTQAPSQQDPTLPPSSAQATLCSFDEQVATAQTPSPTQV